jgi:hypothetical protein
VSIIDSIRRFFERQSDASLKTDSDRIDAMTAARGYDHVDERTEGGAIPPNYLPTGVDEGRPKK